MSSSEQTCELCSVPGGTILWQSADWRVVRVDDGHYPGFCRVIWNAHVREMSDLLPAQRQQLMAAVFAVETAVRRLFSPDKVNLASFGNVVPHLHWHIIPRWLDDRHFPEPIWGQVHRDGLVPRPLVTDEEFVRILALTLQNLNE